MTPRGSHTMPYLLIVNVLQILRNITRHSVLTRSILNLNEGQQSKSKNVKKNYLRRICLMVSVSSDVI